MSTLSDIQFRKNVSKLDVSYMSGIKKDTLTYWCDRLGITYKKANTRHQLAELIFNYFR